MFMSRFIQTDYHAGKIFIQHRLHDSLQLETDMTRKLKAGKKVEDNM